MATKYLEMTSEGSPRRRGRKPLNDPTSSHGGIKREQGSINTVEKIGIIKGGGGVVYGDNSSGGVILITSTKDTDLSGLLELYGGNYWTGKAAADVSASLGNLRVNPTGSYYRTDGYFRNDDSEKYRIGTRLTYDFSPEYSLSPSFDYYGQEGGLVGYPDYPTYFARKKYDFYSGALIAKLSRVKSNEHLERLRQFLAR